MSSKKENHYGESWGYVDERKSAEHNDRITRRDNAQSMYNDSKKNYAEQEFDLKGSRNSIIVIVAMVLVVLVAAMVLSSGVGKKNENNDVNNDNINQSQLTSDVVSRTDSADEVSQSDLTSQTEPTVNALQVSSLSEGDVSKKLDSIAKKYNCEAVQIAIITDGKISVTYEYGTIDKKSENPINADTKIRAASLTKVLVGMTAMKMTEDGYFTLDQDISEIAGYTIKNPKYPNVPITMRHLLTHTSSISSQELDVNSEVTQDVEWLPKKLKQTSIFVKKCPGKAAAFEYSNSGYSVAGYLMEVASQQTLNNYVKENFFKPLGIDAAFCASQLQNKSNIAELRSNIPTNYGLSAALLLERPYYDNPGENSYPYAGDLMISAKDMAQIVCVLMCDGTYNGIQFLSDESVATMEEVHINTGTSTLPRKQCVTLKYYPEQIDDRNMYYHTGAANGVMGYIGYDSKADDGVVIMTIGANNNEKKRDVNRVCLELASECFKELC